MPIAVRLPMRLGLALAGTALAAAVSGWAVHPAAFSSASLSHNRLTLYAYDGIGLLYIGRVALVRTSAAVRVSTGLGQAIDIDATRRMSPLAILYEQAWRGDVRRPPAPAGVKVQRFQGVQGLQGLIEIQFGNVTPAALALVRDGEAVLVLEGRWGQSSEFPINISMTR